jgi:hypothetical protein
MSQKRSPRSKRNRKSHTPRAIAVPTSSAPTVQSSTLPVPRSEPAKPVPSLRSSGLPATRPAPPSARRAPAPKVRSSGLPASRPATARSTRSTPLVSAQYVGAVSRPRASAHADPPADSAPDASAGAVTVLPLDAPAEVPPGVAPEPRSAPPSESVPARRAVTLPPQSAWVGGVVVLVIAVLLALVGLRAMSDHGGDVLTSGDPYSAPVPVAADSAFVRTRVVAPERLRVAHWIHTDRLVHRVRISAPRATAADGGAIVVSDLVLASDGRIVQGERPPSPGSTHTYDVLPGHRIYVTYVLSGALLYGGTPAGRALAPVTSLGVATVGDPVAQVTHSVVGAQVLSLACTPNHPGAIPRPCGTVHDGSWRVDLGKAHAGDRVMAQMNLS